MRRQASNFLHRSSKIVKVMGIGKGRFVVAKQQQARTIYVKRYIQL
jgi:hypothetical protein